VIMTGKKKRVE